MQSFSFLLILLCWTVKEGDFQPPAPVNCFLPDVCIALEAINVRIIDLNQELKSTTNATNNMELRLQTTERQIADLKKNVDDQNKLTQVELNNLKTSITAMDNKIENLKKTHQADKRNLETSIRNMDIKIDNLKTTHQLDINGLKSSISNIQTQINNLNKGPKETKVAFSASLSDGNAAHHGPFGTDTVIKYRHIFTNIGGAYNTATGYFTAPVKGLYHFRFSTYALASHPVTVYLSKNGVTMFGTNSEQAGYLIGASNGAILPLEAGESVCVMLQNGRWIYDDAFHHSTFSGNLVYAL